MLGNIFFLRKLQKEENDKHNIQDKLW
jgi:hypothetical protein